MIAIAGFHPGEREQGIAEKFQSDTEWRRPVEQMALLFRGQVGHRLEVQRDRLLQ